MAASSLLQEMAAAAGMPLALLGNPKTGELPPVGAYVPPNTPPANPWNLMSHADLIAPPAPVEWLCEHMKISYGNPTLFAGEPTSRKTLFAQHIAMCVALGKKVCGEWPVQQGPVGHLDYEMGPRLVKERFQRLSRGLEVEPARWVENDLRLGSIPTLFLDKPEAEAELTSFMTGKALVTIDSMRNSFGITDENDSGKIVTLFSIIQRASERTKCAVILIHHTKKPSGDKSGAVEWDDPSQIRGSGSIVGASQGVFMFKGGDASTPTKVSHVRERWYGRKLPKFRVASQDLQAGDDPRGALAITSMAEDMAGLDDNAAECRALDTRILSFLSGRPGRSFEGGMTAMRAVMGGKQNDIARRIHILIDQGKVLRAGSYREPVYVAK